MIDSRYSRVLPRGQGSGRGHEIARNWGADCQVGREPGKAFRVINFTVDFTLIIAP
jgi:hypothetical protein